MTYKTREQELEELKQYVEYTLNNIDDFERRIRKERRKQMENKLTKEQEKETLEARADFFKGLKGDLNKWWVLSDDEQKHMDSLIRAINNYINYLDK